MLSHDSDWWNGILIVSLAIAALAAFLVMGATAAVIIAQRREAADAKAEFERLKAEAAQANKKAAQANERAADAIKKAADLGVTVDNLSKVAQEKAAEANLAIAALQDATEKATAKVEAVGKQVAEDHSLRNRIRAALASIDQQILREIDAGNLDLRVRMQPVDAEALKRLAEEPGGSELISWQAIGQPMRGAQISNGSLGPKDAVPIQTQFEIKISPALINKN